LGNSELGNPRVVLAGAKQLDDNLHQTTAGLFLVMSPARKLRAYTKEHHARQYLRYLARANEPVMITPDNTTRETVRNLRSVETRPLRVLEWTVIAATIVGGILLIRIADRPAEGDTKRDDGYDIISVAPAARISPLSQSQARPGQSSNPQAQPLIVPAQAHPDKWRNPIYNPNKVDYDAIAKLVAPRDQKTQKEMRDALCAFYDNCR
jgi:hypothetical protein